MSDYSFHEHEHDKENEEMIQEISDFINEHRDEEHVFMRKDGKKIDVKNLVLVVMSEGNFVFQPIPFEKIESIEYKKNHRMKIKYVNGNMSWIDLNVLFDVHMDIDEKPYQIAEDDGNKQENELSYRH